MKTTGEMILYEQPLNEKTRNMLRLERLFTLIDSDMQSEAAHSSQYVLENMLRVVDRLSHTDIRADFIKELEHGLMQLDNLRSEKLVNQQRLDEISSNVDEILTSLHDSQQMPGRVLRNDELVQSFRQRSAVTGGVCSFDAPGFYFWSHQEEEVRSSALNAWYADLIPIRQATKLLLTMIRNNAQGKEQQATGGFYQQNVNAEENCLLVQVRMPATSRCYPEISGGKHRFSIRFVCYKDTQERPLQVPEDVTFQLHCCFAWY